MKPCIHTPCGVLFFLGQENVMTDKNDFLFMGVVISCTENEFKARLIDPVDEDDEEFATISMSWIPEKDRHLIEPGISFVWHHKRGFKFSEEKWSEADIEKVRNSVTGVLSQAAT